MHYINTTRGRPVRFFAFLMGGWIILRVGSTMIGGDIEPLSPIPSEPVAAAETITPRSKSVASTPFSTTRLHVAQSHANAAFFASKKAIGQKAATGGPTGETEYARAALTIMEPAERNPAQSERQAAPPAFPISSPNNASRDRWHASAWLLWREGSGNARDLVTAGRLGGSQAGLRFDYDITPASSSRAAFYGRVSSALNRPTQPEGALGVAWQPARSVPVTIAAERRIALGDGARDASALFAVGGFGPRNVLGRIEAEAYAQAGMVGFNRRDLFADGKLSLLAPVGRAPARAGVSFSGGAQPQVNRLDIGPEVQVRLPLPRAASRLSIEWRERVAGHAAPSSGLAVTLGGDF